MYPITQLNIYPIKGMAGISVEEVQLSSSGFLFDRNWMLVDKNLEFISQRNLPEMALVKVKMQGDEVQVSYKNNQLTFGVYEAIGAPMAVKVWDDFPLALKVSEAVDKQVSQWFEQELSLVKIVQGSREIPKGYVENSHNLSLADGFPYLLIGESSLVDLNQRLPEAISMNRFRPNIVFKGGEAFVEDTFNEFLIGSNRFKMAKPCARCNVTTINQETAEQSKEPLATLAKYRTQHNKVMFGVNLIALNNNGTIRLGDPLVPLY